MWFSKKKATPYTRPTGRRARRSRQVVSALVKHPFPVVMGAIFGVSFLPTLVTPLFFTGSRTYDFIGMISKMVSEVLPRISTIINISLFFMLSTIVFCQLVYVSINAIPDAKRSVLRSLSLSFVIMASLTFFLTMPQSVPFAVWSLAFFVAVNGLGILAMSYSALFLVLVYAVAFLLFFQFTPDTKEAFFSTFQARMVCASVAQLVVGIVAWRLGVRRFAKQWRPAANSMLMLHRAGNSFMSLQKLQSLADPVEEPWIVRWFGARKDCQLELIADTSSWAHPRYANLFFLAKSPPRLYVLGFCFAAAFAVLAVICFDKPAASNFSRFSLFPELGIVFIGSSIPFSSLLQRWRPSFSQETLFPMRYSTYIQAAMKSYLKVFLAVLIPFFTIFPITMLIFAPWLFTPINVITTLFFVVAWLTISVGLTLLGMTASVVQGVIAYFLLLLAIPAMVKFFHPMMPIWISIILIAVGVAFILLGLLRLYLIEPDRVGKW